MTMLYITFNLIISALVALLGKNRTIGYGWSFILCLFVSPIIGAVIILFFKRNKTEYIDAKKL